MFFAPQTILDKKTSHHDIFDVIRDVNVKRHRGNSYVIMAQTCLLENSRKMASVSLTVYEIFKKQCALGLTDPARVLQG